LTLPFRCNGHVDDLGEASTIAHNAAHRDDDIARIAADGKEAVWQRRLRSFQGARPKTNTGAKGDIGFG
jgi:hypothetical protein